MAGRPEDRRIFRRFDCDLAARALFAGRSGATLEREGRILEVSAGGVRWRSPNLGLGRGERVSIVIPRGTQSGATVVLPARVVWARADQTGLQFDGDPRSTRFEIPPVA